MQPYRFQVLGTKGMPEQWRAVGDPVMGGVSVSRMQPLDEHTSEFTGNVSLANGGGFASVTFDLPQPLFLPGAQGLEVQAEADGHHYKLGLRTHVERSAAVYQHPLALPAHGWQTLRLALSNFTARRRGQALADAPPLAGSPIVAISLYISGGQAGPFALKLRSIQVY